MLTAKSTYDYINMESFAGSLNVLIVGASGGIGGAVISNLSKNPRTRIWATARKNIEYNSDMIIPLFLDLNDEKSIKSVAENIANSGNKLDLVLVATGFLHDALIKPEKTWKSLNHSSFNKSFSINCIGPALVAKHILPLLRKESKSVFAVLSARIGSISDNHIGGWHSYRASKAALNMLIRTLAVELSRTNPSALCVSLHPGTVDTSLSLPFQRGVSKEQLFNKNLAASQLLNVIDTLTINSSGGLYAWDGKSIAF